MTTFFFLNDQINVCPSQECTHDVKRLQFDPIQKIHTDHSSSQQTEGPPSPGRSRSTREGGHPAVAGRLGFRRNALLEFPGREFSLSRRGRGSLCAERRAKREPTSPTGSWWRGRLPSRLLTCGLRLFQTPRALLPGSPSPPGMLPSPPGSHAVPCFLDCRSRVYCTENGQHTVLRSVHDQDRFRNHRVEGEMRLCPAPSFCCANELGWLWSHFLIVSIIVRRLEGARFGDRSGTLDIRRGGRPLSDPHCSRRWSGVCA